MANKLYQPNFQSEQDTNQAKQINVAAARYEAWRELIKTKTMREYWQELGIEIGKSVNGYDAIIMGKGNVTNIARNTISALNAIADLPKYAKLVWHEHISMFDPRRDCFDIKVTWNQVKGLLEFYNWRNGSFTPSMLNFSPAQIIKRYARRLNLQQGQPFPKFLRDILNKQRNIVAKHNELERFLAAQELDNSRYMIVMATTEAKEHFEKNILPFLDQPFDVYYQAEIARWNSADAESTLSAPIQESNNFHLIVSEKVKSERTELLNDLIGSGQKVDVFYTTLTSTVPQKRTFDPSAPENNKAPFISLQAIADAPGSFKFSLGGDGATKHESKGKAAK